MLYYCRHSFVFITTSRFVICSFFNTCLLIVHYKQAAILASVVKTSCSPSSDSLLFLLTGEDSSFLPSSSGKVMWWISPLGCGHKWLFQVRTINCQHKTLGSPFSPLPHLFQIEGSPDSKWGCPGTEPPTDLRWTCSMSEKETFLVFSLSEMRVVCYYSTAQSVLTMTLVLRGCQGGICLGSSFTSTCGEGRWEQYMKSHEAWNRIW